jgi:aspartate racemase
VTTSGSQAAASEPARFSRHVGLVGGLGVGAAVIYYRAIAAGCVSRAWVPRITIAHADAPTTLALVEAGRIGDLADYLAGLAAELAAADAELFAIPAVTPHIALAALKGRSPLPIVDMLETTARRLRDRGVSRIALFGTRFTIETELFGALGAFDVAPPRPREVDDIHRIYLELARDGHTSPANIETLRQIAAAIRRRDGIEAIVLASTDLNLIFSEASAGFPAVDCAAAHIERILSQSLS